MKEVLKKYVVLLVFLWIGRIGFCQTIFYNENISQTNLGIDDLGFSQYSFDATVFLAANHPLPSSSATPAPMYKYLWSFGDGQFSTQAQPTHTYAKSGPYEVQLFVTPIYVPMGPPPSFTALSVINAIGQPGFTHNNRLGFDEAIRLSINRNPRPGTESTYMILFKNKGVTPAFIPVDFKYNSSLFSKVKFIGFMGEIITTETTTGDPVYPDKITFRSNKILQPNEERLVLIQLYTKHDVVGELVDVPNVGMRVTHAPGLFFQASTTQGAATYNSFLSTYAVGSWDPNNKIVDKKNVLKSYADSTDTIKMRYRINVENIGSAQTHKVEIVDQVDNLLDIQSFNYIADKNSHDSLKITVDTVHRTVTFTFKELTLEGASSATNTDIEACRHWVDFEFDLNKDTLSEKYNDIACPAEGTYVGHFGKNASITFDNNPAILTNMAITNVHCDEMGEKKDVEEIKDEKETTLVSIENIYPNPSKGSATISYSVNKETESTFSLSVIDLSNSKKKNLRVKLSNKKGEHDIKVGFSEYKKGNYIFEITDGKHSWRSKKFQKL